MASNAHSHTADVFSSARASAENAQRGSRCVGAPVRALAAARALAHRALRRISRRRVLTREASEDSAVIASIARRLQPR